MRHLVALSLLVASIPSPGGTARADGTAQLGTSQAVRAGTSIGVDVVEPSLETIRFQGAGSVTVFAPNGASLGTFGSGQVIVPSAGAGAYTVRIGSQQNIGTSWDVSVLGAVDPGGRIFSTNWQFNAGSFAASAASSSSFFALVPNGGSGFGVIELDLDGLAGYIYDIQANRRGVDGVDAGRSVPEAGHTSTPEYRIYLRIPSKATFDLATPGVFGLDYVGGVSTDVAGGPIEPCDDIAPGVSRGYFYFNSTVSGTYHLQCDLDGDGTMRTDSTADLLLVGTAALGTNVATWDGTWLGAPVAPGTYDCRVRVTVGEFHYVGRDIETSYLGMRMYRVNADASRTGLPMYWNDAAVSAGDVLLPNGQPSRVSSAGEVVAGAYGSAAVPNVNARAWGDFTGNGKGNVSFLDTYVWLAESTSAPVDVRAVAPGDADADGLGDFEERCLVGSDPNDADTDGDGVPDGQQYGVPESTAFSGLESNGRMATALARRAIRRLRISEAPGAAVAALESTRWVDGFVPDHVADASAVSTSPQDLVGLTNAVEVSGADYVTPAGVRIAGLLAVVTHGGPYEHTRPVCDRVEGARLLDVAVESVAGIDVLHTTLSAPEEGRLEHALTLSLIETDDGHVVPRVAWLAEAIPGVAADARVVTLQIWGRTVEDLRAVAAAAITRLGTAIRRAAERVPLDESTVAFASPPYVADAVRAPAAFVERVETFAGTTTLSLRRASSVGRLALRGVGLRDDAVSVTRFERVVDPSVGNTVVLDTRGLLELTVDLVADGRVEDRVWTSDGAFASIDDGLAARDGAADDGFRRDLCTVRDPATDPASPVVGVHAIDVLPGCASTALGRVERHGGIARHLTRPLRGSAGSSLVAFVRSDRAYSICLEGLAGRRCVSMPASAGEYVAVPLSAFAGVAAEVVEFSVGPTKRLSMEVAGVAIVEGSFDTRHAGGGAACAVGLVGQVSGGMPPASARLAVLAVLAVLVVRTRRSARVPRG